MEWALPSPNAGSLLRFAFRAVVDEQKIAGLGTATHPFLSINPVLKRQVSPEKHDAYGGVGWHEPAFRFVQLLPDHNNGSVPLADSGLLLPQFLCGVALRREDIELLAAKAEAQEDKSATLFIRVGFVLPGQAVQDMHNDYFRSQPNNAGPIANLPSLVTIWSDNPGQVSISAARWQSFLKAWGWPETRLLTLQVALPGRLAENTPAAKRWAAACSALEQAHEDRRNGNYDAAGNALRVVLAHALYTWCAVWGDDSPGEKQSPGQAIDFISNAIPECRPQEGKRPKNAPPDHKRLCAVLSLLWQLYGLSQEAHHPVGVQEVYMPEDIDHILTSTTALLRSLPSLWHQFPAKPATT